MCPERRTCVWRCIYIQSAQSVYPCSFRRKAVSTEAPRYVNKINDGGSPEGAETPGATRSSSSLSSSSTLERTRARRKKAAGERASFGSFVCAHIPVLLASARIRSFSASHYEVTSRAATVILYDPFATDRAIQSVVRLRLIDAEQDLSKRTADADDIYGIRNNGVYLAENDLYDPFSSVVLYVFRFLHSK